MEEDAGGKGHENGLSKHQRVMGGAGQVRSASGVGATYPMLEAENLGVWKAEPTMSRSKCRRLNNDAILMVDYRRGLDKALYKEAGGETQRLLDSKTDDEHEQARQGREVTFDHVQQRFCYWQDMVDNQATALAKWHAHYSTERASTSSTSATGPGEPTKDGAARRGAALPTDEDDPGEPGQRPDGALTRGRWGRAVATAVPADSELGRMATGWMRPQARRHKAAARASRWHGMHCGT